MPSRKSCLALAALILAPFSAAHMIMDNPVPFAADKVDSGPLVGGADFPCKKNLGFSVSKQNTMAVGEQQTLSFKGTAVHGGGSCQLSVTTDKEPSPQSKFKVIKSIEGGCPGVDGGPATFSFTLPKEVPSGDLVFAWTWFAKLSGRPEMYMNCAPITVTGGASDASGLDALPDMFVANVPEAQGCTSPLSADTAFPNGGSEVEKSANGKLQPPTGNCGAAAPPGNDDGQGGGNAPTPAPSAPAAPSAPGEFFPAPSPAPTSVPVVPVEPPAPSDALPTSTVTTLVTVTGVPAPGPTSNPDPNPGAPAPNPGGNATSCSTEGAVVCNGPTQFGLCNHGSVVWQAVAAGTQCQGGAIVKRDVHGAHVRRHVRGKAW